MSLRIIKFPDPQEEIGHEIKRLNNRLKKTIKRSRPAKIIKQKIKQLSSKLYDSD